VRRVIVVAVALCVLAAVATGIALAASAAAPKPKPKPITVNMFEYRFKLSKRTNLKHGVPYTFKVVNKGQVVHNFDIQSVKASKIIAHGKTTRFTVTFKKAGRYPYVCDVPRHGELGMVGFLVVV